MPAAPFGRHYVKPQADTPEHIRASDALLMRLWPAIGTEVSSVRLGNETGIPKEVLRRWIAGDIRLPAKHHKKIEAWIAKRGAKA